MRLTITAVAIGFVATTLTLLVNPSRQELRAVEVSKTETGTTRRHERSAEASSTFRRILRS